MIESQFLKKFKADLEDRGFYYKKIADGSTRGLPDTFIAKEGKGAWIEGKLIERRYLPAEVISPSIFKTGTKQSIQMMTMVEMDNHFFARYVMGIDVRGELHATIIAPMSVFNLVKHGNPFQIKTFPYKEFLGVFETILRLS